MLSFFLEMRNMLNIYGVIYGCQVIFIVELLAVLFYAIYKEQIIAFSNELYNH